MSTIRVQKNKDNPYVSINKTALNDPNLSFKAKGIFAYLMSKPDDWKCQINDLRNNSSDGRDSIYSGLKELREHGYIIKRPIKNEKNIIEEWEEILFETPRKEAKDIFKEQKIINERAALKRAETIKEKKNKPLTENPDMGKTTYGKSGYGKTRYGKPVDIINNNTTNNDLINNELVVGVVPSIAINEFENNVCELKRTTKEKFLKYCNMYNEDFILCVIEYAASINIKSYAGFETIIKTYIAKNITTREEMLNDIEKVRNERKKKPRKSTTNDKISNFNNYDQRKYTKEDYDRIEERLIYK